MKKLLLPAILGISISVTGHTSPEHKHNKADQTKSPHGGHSQMMQNHHSPNNHKSMMGGSHEMGHGSSLAGRPGKESEADRIIRVKANDSMRFIHDPIKVKTGEAIKFEVTNAGAIPHEFSIGTKDEHIMHGKMMMNNSNMHHGPGGSSVTILPGKTETLTWYFEEAWEVQVACNIPGHYQAGMHSDIEFGD